MIQETGVQFPEECRRHRHCYQYHHQRSVHLFVCLSKQTDGHVAGTARFTIWINLGSGGTVFISLRSSRGSTVPQIPHALFSGVGPGRPWATPLKTPQRNLNFWAAGDANSTHAHAHIHAHIHAHTHTHTTHTHTQPRAHAHWIPARPHLDPSDPALDPL